MKTDGSLSSAHIAGAQLHDYLASVVGLLHRARPAWPKLLGLGELLALADAADPNYDDGQGHTVLGWAVQLWLKPPTDSDDLMPLVLRLLERGASPDAPFRTCASIEVTPLGFVLTQFRPEVGSPASASASVPVSGSRLGWSSWSPPGPDTPLPEQVWEMFRPHVNLGLEHNQKAVAWWISEAAGRPLTPVAQAIQSATVGARLGLKLPAPAPRAAKSLARF